MTTRLELHERAARSLLEQEPGDTVARAFSDGVEELLRAATPADAPYAVLAQGGLARRDLVPFSDVDVLVLTRGTGPDDATAPLYALWDQGFRVGHAVRSVDDLAELFDSIVEKDGHAATALIEARFIAGDRALADSALKHVRRELFPAKRKALVEEKLRELHARRARFGGSAYAQEPDVKNGPGGLRDLHGLLWVGLLRAGEGARDPSGDLVLALLGAGVLHPAEATALRRGRAELLAVRAALHLACGRADDRLHAAQAEKAAPLLDTAPGHVGESAAEALCRRTVTALALVKRTVDDALARVTPRTVDIAGAVSGPVRRARALGGGFFDVDGELHVDADVPLDVAAVVDAARLIADNALAPSAPFAARRAAALDAAIAAYARGAHGTDTMHAHDANEGAARSLLALCSSTTAKFDDGAGPFTRLLEWGALGLVLDEIHRLSARVHLDGVHALTTDAHLARCADLALAVVAGTGVLPQPLAASLARTTRPHLVVLAALFHDMGKGLPDDHSVAGERIVQREAARMGLAVDDVDILRFLVRDHLLLSRVSQRRDLADPAVIEELAAAVRTSERVDLLALLTWVDMCAVAPGVGTEWKARLLGTAVERTRALLLAPDGALARVVDDDVRARARAAIDVGAARSTAADAFVAGATVRFLASRGDDDLRDDFGAFERYSEDPGRATATVSLAPGRVYEVRVVAPDRPGLLADVAAALASEGANVLHATLDVRGDGIAFDSFVVDDGRGGRLEPESASRLPGVVAEAARGERAVAARFKRAGRTRVEPRIRVLPSDSFGRAVVEVRGADRIGLLADLARAFAEQGYSIALARIHTEGPRVTDVFTVERVAAGADPAALERTLLAVVSPE